MISTDQFLANIFATPTICIVPCGAEKAESPTKARDLYLSSTFRSVLAGAEEQCDKVYILSAKHGLLDLDEEVAPYDTTMGAGDEEEISNEELAQQFEAILADHPETLVDVYTMLPKKYLAKLDPIAREQDCYLQDSYEATRGIGDHRGVARQSQEMTKERFEETIAKMNLALAS